MSVFARVRVQGTPFERGVQYGTQARDQVAATRDGYQRAFKSAGIEWSDAVAMAQRYLAPIEKFASNSLQEMRGIAEGAGISFDDVLAINCRTEILWSAKTKPRGECSSFALAPAAYR